MVYLQEDGCVYSYGTVCFTCVSVKDWFILQNYVTMYSARNMKFKRIFDKELQRA
jgi:hypothetical protein